MSLRPTQRCFEYGSVGVFVPLSEFNALTHRLNGSKMVNTNRGKAGRREAILSVFRTVYSQNKVTERTVKSGLPAGFGLYLRRCTVERPILFQAREFRRLDRGMINKLEPQTAVGSDSSSTSDIHLP